jgi:hypothetical protein
MARFQRFGMGAEEGDEEVDVAQKKVTSGAKGALVLRLRHG